jgi:hypothetical protein
LNGDKEIRLGVDGLRFGVEGLLRSEGLSERDEVRKRGVEV